MELTVLTVLLLLTAAWMGFREMGINFLGIHIRDMVSMEALGTMLLLATAAAVAMTILSQFKAWTISLSLNQAYIIMCAIVITIAVMRAAGQYTSVITAFWGTLAALSNHGELSQQFPVLESLVSLIVLPIAGLLLFLLYCHIFEHGIYRKSFHLLLKSLYMKRLALAGIILGIISLAINFALFSTPFIEAILEHLAGTQAVTVGIAAIALSVAVTIPTTMVVRTENPRLKQMRQSLPLLYALLTVLLLGNVAGTLLLAGMTPVLVSPSQVRACALLTMSRSPHRIFRLVSITIVTPLVSFLVAMMLMNLVKNSIIMAIATTFALVTCLLVMMYYRQRRKHYQAVEALNDELTHNSETDDERSRLNVAAVTSQFNVITNEIDIKHKELVNLSLYIKQQRQYLEDLSKSLNELTSEDNVPLLRQKLRETAHKLNENMRLTGEMDHFYTQVEEQHKNFVSRLLMRCPNLSEKEKRLAILLRLGLSSKDISSMMNVEPKSVEVSRYRFRRKLKLDRSVNIVQFLQMI